MTPVPHPWPVPWQELFLLVPPEQLDPGQAPELEQPPVPGQALEQPPGPAPGQAREPGPVPGQPPEPGQAQLQVPAEPLGVARRPVPG
jgi:hypothetical protein